jgi:hypothetical protein
VKIEVRKAVKLSNWRLPIGRISRKGLNYFGQSKSKRVGETPTSYGKKSAKITKLPHSITSMYKEIECIFEKDRRSLCHKGNHYSPCLLWLNVIKCHPIH